MAWTLGVCASVYYKVPLGVQQLAVLEREGIRCFEYSSYFDPDDTNALNEVSAFLRDSPLDCWSLHSRGSLLLEMDMLRKDLEFAAEVGARIVVLHSVNWSSYNAQGLDKTGDETERMRVCKEALSELAGMARDLGLKLAVENLPPRMLTVTSQDMLELVSGLDPEIVGVCADTGHALLGPERPAELVRKLGNRVMTLHIADNDGEGDRHWVPLRGIIDWPSVVCALREAGYRGPFMYEAMPEVPGTPARGPEALEEKVRMIRENYRELNAICAQ